ncbi:MAG: hypothetical protein ACI35M_06030 [Alistipes sp.]
MKKLLSLMAVASMAIALFTSCEKDESPKLLDTPTFESLRLETMVASRPADETDMQAFLEQIGRMVFRMEVSCYFADNSCYEVKNSSSLRQSWYGFALFDDNTGMLFNYLESAKERNLLKWEVDENDPMSIIVSSEWMTEPEKYLTPDEVKQCNFVNNTKITLLYFHNGTAIVKGLQPFCYYKYGTIQMPDYIISEHIRAPYADIAKEKERLLGK